MTQVQSTLSVGELSITLPSSSGTIQILDSVDIGAMPGHVLGIVGESGSGKTMTARAIFGLLPKGARVSGSVRWCDVELRANLAYWERLLGRQFAMVFQDPRSSLHPTVTVGRQLGWAMARAGVIRRLRRERSGVLLDQVGLRDIDRVLAAYPHQLSGGMCQRAALAIALATSPQLLIADEPTSALDPTVQLQIADLIRHLTIERNLTTILITHDIGLVAYVCDEVAVLNRGRLVESGSTGAVLGKPAHDYTRQLLAAVQ